jgi:hypothetical protein
MTRRTMKTAANVTREIASMKKRNDKWDDIALFFRRNATFWTRLQAEGAWDGQYTSLYIFFSRFKFRGLGLLLLDPPVREDISLKTNGGWHVVPLESYPYQGGYRDFSPWPELPRDMKTTGGPPRTSVLDDVAFYWTKAASPQEINEAISDRVRIPKYL